MPRYKRRYRRRFRTLRSTNIAMNKSARSQARQIMALKRYIRRVDRRDKPELRVVQYTAVGLTKSSNSNSNSLIGNVQWQVNTQGSAQIDAILPPLGTVSYNVAVEGTSTTPNNFCKLIQSHIYGFLSYTSEVKRPCIVRLVVAQLKLPLNSINTANSIFTSSNPNNNYAPLIAAVGPLQSGVSRTVKILAERKYILNDQIPSRTIKISLRRLMNYYRDTNSATSGNAVQLYGKGGIVVYYQVYHESSNEADPTSVSIDLFGKLVFTDD